MLKYNNELPYSLSNLSPSISIILSISDKSIIKKKKSTKISNPLIFIYNINPKKDDQYFKIIMKFKINNDYYSTSFSRIVYIISRLSDKVASYTLNRKIKRYFNSI